jgi:hypothetical protein
MLRIPNWRLALPLTLRRKDRLELFFEARGHGQAFDDHVVQGSPGDRVQGHLRFLGFGDELRILQRFQKSRFRGAHPIAWHVLVVRKNPFMLREPARTGWPNW